MPPGRRGGAYAAPGTAGGGGDLSTGLYRRSGPSVAPARLNVHELPEIALRRAR